MLARFGIMAMAIVAGSGGPLAADLKLDTPKDVTIQVPAESAAFKTLIQVELATSHFVPGTKIIVKSGEDGTPIASISPFGVGTEAAVTSYSVIVPPGVSKSLTDQSLKLRFEVLPSKSVWEPVHGPMSVALRSVSAKPADSEK